MHTIYNIIYLFLYYNLQCCIYFLKNNYVCIVTNIHIYHTQYTEVDEIYFKNFFLLWGSVRNVPNYSVKKSDCMYLLRSGHAFGYVLEKS